MRKNTNFLDKLPILQRLVPTKIREKCKYWPVCRQGNKCEFMHPNSNCENFPNCNFGDNCLYLHPKCKFRNSCTKRNCFFSHAVTPAPASKFHLSNIIIVSIIIICIYKLCMFLKEMISKNVCIQHGYRIQ